jgi:hypothetical protein
MRTFKTLLLAVVITMVGVLFADAKEEPRKNDLDKISKKIERLLEEPGFDVQEELLIKVTLVFNEDNEMVVLSDDAKNKDLSYYIKSKLNYHTLNDEPINNNGKYVLPVRLVPSTKSSNK